MNRTATTQFFLAGAIGIAHASISAFLWPYFIPVSPIDDWLISVLGAQGSTTAFHIAAYATDLAVFVLRATPFAYLVSLLRPNNSWKLLWIALAASTSVLFALIAVESPEVIVIITETWLFFVVGMAIFTISLPLAFVAVIHVGPCLKETQKIS